MVTKEELNHFLEDRIDVVLNRLEMPPMFGREKGVISGCFLPATPHGQGAGFLCGRTQLQYTGTGPSTNSPSGRNSPMPFEIMGVDSATIQKFEQLAGT